MESNTSKMMSIVRQCIAGSTANLVSMCAGCLLGWTAPVLPMLEMPDSILHATAEQGSWIGSLVPLGAAIGPFPGGYLADKIGRKWTLLGLALPLLLGWTLITAAQNVSMIYIGRLICGVAMGGAYTVAPMYAGEIAEDKIRGGLGSLSYFFLSAGFLFEYAIGPYVSYVWLGVISMTIPIVFAVTFCFMPESPYYLLSQGKREEASKALQWLRCASEKNVDEELKVMNAFVEDSSKIKSPLKELFATSGNVKALCLTCGLVGFQILSGIDAVLFYSTTIFTLSGGTFSGDTSTIVVGVVMLIFAVVAPLVVDRTGRKPMLYLSGLGMAVAELTLGMYFYFKDVEGRDLSAVGWIPVVSLVFDIAVCSVGYGPLPWVIMSEMFPSNIKGIASAVTASFCWFLGFLVTKFFQNIVNGYGLGMHIAFWIYASFSFLSNVFVFLLLPETKGKSFQEIQDVLNKKVIQVQETNTIELITTIPED